MNAKQRKRLRAFERLSHLTNLGKYLGSENAEEFSLSQQLSIMVKSGGQAKDIASAREQVARLHTIATTLYDEVHDLMTDSDSFGIKEEDQPHFEKLCDELSDLKKELHGRGGIGCSEPMKSAAAERMRSKLEAKMLPKLNADIPKWAERLRFLHSDVLKWSAPYRLLDEPAAVEDAPAADDEEEYPDTWANYTSFSAVFPAHFKIYGPELRSAIHGNKGFENICERPRNGRRRKSRIRDPKEKSWSY